MNNNKVTNSTSTTTLDIFRVVLWGLVCIGHILNCGSLYENVAREMFAADIYIYDIGMRCMYGTVGSEYDLNIICIMISRLFQVDRKTHLASYVRHSVCSRGAKAPPPKRSDGKAKCVRYGCQMEYLVAQNTETSCKHHTGPPVFHDSGKYWSCCPKQVKYDFDEFLCVPGCAVSAHSDVRVSP
jgi:hypothetical protein